MRLDTEDPYVDDDLLTAVIRMRAGKPRWEAAWHFRGDIRIAPGVHPIVFVNNRFVPGSVCFSEDLPLPIWKNYARRLAGRPTLRVDRALLIRESWTKITGICFTTSSPGSPWQTRSISIRQFQLSSQRIW